MSRRAPRLSHFDDEGNARMVDIGSKAATSRKASAEALVAMSAEALTAIREGTTKKGSVVGVARIAGIMAAKRTHELIPLCHPLALTGIDVNIEVKNQGVRIIAEVHTTDRTGVEMEALTAASVAALTVYDMCKAIDRSMEILSVRLMSKSGGRTGAWKRRN